MCAHMGQLESTEAHRPAESGMRPQKMQTRVTAPGTAQDEKAVFSFPRNSSVPQGHRSCPSCKHREGKGSQETTKGKPFLQ